MVAWERIPKDGPEKGFSIQHVVEDDPARWGFRAGVVKPMWGRSRPVLRDYTTASCQENGNVVALDMSVAGNQRQFFHLRLGNQHPIKGISVMRR